MIAPSGAVFGVTQFGGAFGFGSIFQLVAPGAQGGMWTENVLYSFMGSLDGAYPNGVILGPNGDLYGVTRHGGTYDDGTAFKLTPTDQTGGMWTETVTHNFGGTGDGWFPFANLTPGPNGTLFGTTVGGGANGLGTAFVLSAPAVKGGEWSEQVIYNFREIVAQFSSLTLTPSGALLGTWSGYPGEAPSIAFALTPPQSSGEQWNYATLYEVGQPGSGTALSPLLNVGTTTFGSAAVGGTHRDGFVYQLVPSTAGNP